ncbi:MAG: OsmC family protein [Gemmatimonadaceae bacterium]
MERQEEVRDAVERHVNAVTLRPSVGQGTAVTRVRLRDGLACDVEDGPWKITVGMTDKYGGSNAGPNPGIYGRAALGACLAIGYAMWASRMGVPLQRLEVEIQADYDLRGELGVDETVRPGYLRMRYIVSVESDAPEEDVIRMLDIAERHSSFLDDFANPVDLQREVRLTAPKS